MSLPQLQIKLHRPSDGLIRKITFDTPPSWTTLAAKIEALYHIAQADVAVSYLDADGDEITLSSEGELQEYYRTLPPGAPGESKVAKLTVRDLGAERNKPLPSTPPTGSSNLHGGFRNTFGVPMMFDVEEEEEWQRVPQALSSLFGVGRDESVDSGPHAFVETIDSQSQVQEQDRDDIVDAITIPDSELTETTPAPTQDKGKVRANSSQESVIGSQTPDKYPIHVVDLNAMDIDDILEKGRTSPIPPSEPVPGQAPRASTASSSTVSDSEAPEPPLPDLENLGNPTSSATSRAPSPTVSLTNDVANLFSTLSAVIASHPELSEGVRNLVRNAANGTYWQAHRQAVSRATDDLRRTAEASSADAVRIASEARRAAEEAAGRRVAEAIANVVRAIGDVAGTTASPSDAAPSTSTTHGPQRSFSERRPATFPFPPDFQMAMESLSDLADPRAWMSERGGRRGHGFRHRHGRFSMHQAASAPGSAYVPPPPPAPPSPPPPPQQPPRPTSPSGPPAPPPPPPATHEGHAVPPPPGPPPSIPMPPPPPAPGMFGGPLNIPLPFFPSAAGIPPPPNVHDFYADANSPSWGGRWWQHPHPPPPPFYSTSPHAHTFPHRRGFSYGRDMADTFMPPYPYPARSRNPWKGDERGAERDSDSPDDVEHEEVSMFGVAPGPTRQSTDEAKRALLEAKQRYKAEKARYRREKEERHRPKENAKKMSRESAEASKKQADKDKGKGKAPAQTEAVPEPPAQIISAARGPYPQLEMLSVSPPRRHHTMHGTGTGTHRAQEASKSKENPAVSSITRRLGDMGFTEDKFPSIYAQVMARVPSQGELSREAEDSVVSDVLEDLLLMSPVQSPQPSGSGAHAGQAEDGIPGAFP